MTAAECEFLGTTARRREQQPYVNSIIGRASETQRNIIGERWLGLARERR